VALGLALVERDKSPTKQAALSAMAAGGALGVLAHLNLLAISNALALELFAPDFVLLALAPDVFGAAGCFLLLAFALPLRLLSHGEPPVCQTAFIFAQGSPSGNSKRANGERH
jgi:hypothetical protein